MFVGHRHGCQRDVRGIRKNELSVNDTVAMADTAYRVGSRRPPSLWRFNMPRDYAGWSKKKSRVSLSPLRRNHSIEMAQLAQKKDARQSLLWTASCLETICNRVAVNSPRGGIGRRDGFKIRFLHGSTSSRVWPRAHHRFHFPDLVARLNGLGHILTSFWEAETGDHNRQQELQKNPIFSMLCAPCGAPA